MTLTRDLEHDPDIIDSRGGWLEVECQKCGERQFLMRVEVEGGGMRGRCIGLRKSRLKDRSETNSGRAHQRDEAYREYVRGLPCVVCGERPCDAAHYRSWGAGHGDEGNLVPLCRRHHSEQHAVGIETFEDRHGLDLAAEAERIGRKYEEAE